MQKVQEEIWNGIEAEAQAREETKADVENLRGSDEQHFGSPRGCPWGSCLDHPFEMFRGG